jgi:hypothetical protein
MTEQQVRQAHKEIQVLPVPAPLVLQALQAQLVHRAAHQAQLVMTVRPARRVHKEIRAQQVQESQARQAMMALLVQQVQ